MAEPAFPVFIVGSPRSGTSILVAGLRHAGYGGFLEGNFLSLIQFLARDIDRHFAVFHTTDDRVLTSRIDVAALKDRVAHQLLHAALAEQPAGPWLDKTGGVEMIQAIPTLRRLLPGSRFVFAKRRAIENVASRLIKFPTLSFDYHCADWARVMAAWRALRTAAPGPDLIEVDQRAISRMPDAVAARLGAFLGLSPAQVARMDQIFVQQRPQQTAPGTSDRVLTLNGTGWSDAQRATFDAHCAHDMAAEGYSTGEDYWLHAADSAP